MNPFDVFAKVFIVLTLLRATPQNGAWVILVRTLQLLVYSIMKLSKPLRHDREFHHHFLVPHQSKEILKFDVFFVVSWMRAMRT